MYVHLSGFLMAFNDALLTVLVMSDVRHMVVYTEAWEEQELQLLHHVLSRPLLNRGGYKGGQGGRGPLVKSLPPVAPQRVQ